MAALLIRIWRWFPLIVLLLLGGWLYVAEPMQSSLRDFDVYFAASLRFAAGESLYERMYESVTPNGHSYFLSYFYPPFLAQWMQIFTWTSHERAQQLWVMISALSLLWAASSLTTLLRAAWGVSLTRRKAFTLSLAALLCFEPTYWAAKEGQVNAILLALLCAALVLIYRRSLFAGGALLAIASLLKMSPAILLLVPLVQREWRVLWGFGLTVAVATVTLVLSTPAQVYQSFFQFVGPVAQGTLERQSMFNFALDKALLGAFGLDNYALLRWAVRLLVAGALIAGVWKLRHGSDKWARLLPYFFVLPGMVALSPTLWGHHLLWVLPSLIVLMAAKQAHQDAQYRVWCIGLGLYVLFGQTMMAQLTACRAVLLDRCIINAESPVVTGVSTQGAPQFLLSATTLLPALLLGTLALCLLRVMLERQKIAQS